MAEGVDRDSFDLEKACLRVRGSLPAALEKACLRVRGSLLAEEEGACDELWGGRGVLRGCGMEPTDACIMGPTPPGWRLLRKVLCITDEDEDDRRASPAVDGWCRSLVSTK